MKIEVAALVVTSVLSIAVIGLMIYLYSGTKSQYAEAQALLASAEISLDSASKTNRALIEDNANLSGTLTQARDENTRLSGNLFGAEKTITTLNAQIRKAEQEYVAQTAALNASEAAFLGIEEEVGAVNDLARHAAELREEIRRLKAIREPLILEDGDLRVANSFCTGSMEPTISCLDEVIHLTDFDPEAIDVGHIIGFRGCNSGRWTRHRVIEVKSANGNRYFRTKGDANREADSCWTQQDSVSGYVVEVRRGVRPQNAELRLLVNASRLEYYNLLDRHCGNIPASECVLPGGIFEEVDNSRVTYLCWLKVAREAKYDGHIKSRC